MPQTRDRRQLESVEVTPLKSMPVVDFKKLLTSDAETTRLRAACLETGFFTINNALGHSTAITQALHQMERFFALDDEDSGKLSVSVRQTGNKRGWTPLFGEPAYQPGTIAHVESFDFGREGGNVWPELPSFRHDIRNCWQAISDIGDTILEALALAAGVDRNFFTENCDTRELSTMRLLNYPANDVPASDDNVGIAAHTDFECITLLVQNAPGLELRTRTGKWFDAPSDTGQIVVLLGDMIERWTNGLFQATGHRVRNSNENRMSIVMFFAVNDDVSVAPLPRFTGADCPPRYTPAGQRAHLAAQVLRAERNRDEKKADET